MISILIPVFNFDIRQLVADLSAQCDNCQVPYEILCYDDGSEDSFKKLNCHINAASIKYEEMPQNLGRSAIRNALGKAAKYPYLIFMDCDSKVVRSDYIKSYLNHLEPKRLLYGSRSYQSHPPIDPQYLLHWKFGTQREVSTAEERSKNPWDSFMTNNFVIPKSNFLEILFDESLTQYGHEDTLFGMELKNNKVEILHLNNPLQHIGLETADVFIKKTEQGIENLFYLYKKNTLVNTKLLSLFKKLKIIGATSYTGKQFSFLSSFLLKNLKSKNPSLKALDLYKLLFFCHLELQNKKIYLNRN